MAFCDEILRAYEGMANGPVQIGELPEWMRSHGDGGLVGPPARCQDIGEKATLLRRSEPPRRNPAGRRATYASAIRRITERSRESRLS